MKIEICDVGPRDGLQIERAPVATADKIALVEGLMAAGVRRIQVTSFVSPRAVPQLADAEAVLAGVRRRPGVALSALVPNRRGAERAAATTVDVLGLFVSASETHNRKNMNASRSDTLAGFAAVAEVAARAGKALSGGVATAFGCPFEGEVDPAAVVEIAKVYRDLGATDLNLGDTTGMATPTTVRRLLDALRVAAPDLPVTLHFHNTRGVGLANVMVGLEMGVTRYDASIAGLGGCPFAAGATGNVCTEDLVYLLEESGHDTGVDLDRLIETATWLEGVLGRTLPGQVMKAGPRLRLHPADAVATADG